MFSNLLQLYLRYLIKKKKFLEILVKADLFKQESDWLCHVYYRLSMYQTVIKQAYPAHNPLGQASYIASMAACGHTREAKALVQTLTTRHDISTKNRVILAEILAPFLPESALALLDQAITFSPVLHALLLIRTNQPDKARHVITTALQTGKGADKPELYLLMANMQAALPSNQLAYTNKYLAHYGLETLFLKNPDLPPGAINVSCFSNHTRAGPLVSILVTTFRGANRIGSTIESLLQQTYRNIEIIVINDASDDDTDAVMQDWIKLDSRVRYFKLPVNVGTFTAKNLGLQYAAGEFVTCQDSDDWAHPRKIEYQIQPLLENPNLVCTTSQWVRIQDDGLYYARLVYPLTRLNPASPLFRKKLVLSRMGAWDWVRTGADSEFLERMKLVFGSSAVLSVKKPLTLGAHRPDSLMTAADTGYNEQGISEIRLNYWEAWKAWHVNCLKTKTIPAIHTIPDVQRPFPVLEHLMVNPEKIMICRNKLKEDQ